MSIDLLVAADVFVRALAGGEDDWQHLGSRYHQMDFITIEKCESVRDELADRIAEFLEAEARDWWTRELDANSSELRIEISAECRNNASQAQ